MPTCEHVIRGRALAEGSVVWGLLMLRDGGELVVLG
jgi:hypothetical protein